MSNRYPKSKTVITTIDEPQLKNLLDNRGLKNITHYTTPEIKYPDIESIKTFDIIKHTWKFEDRYWKLSYEYYGNPKYWWIIALYNKKPIEAMNNVGDIVRIPQPLSDVLGAIS